MIFTFYCLKVTPHTRVIPAEAGIQIFFTNKKEGLDSRVEFTLMKMGAGMTKKSEDKGKNGRCEGLL